MASKMDRATRRTLDHYPGLKRSQYLKVDLTLSVFEVLCKGSRVERLSAYTAIKDQVMAEAEELNEIKAKNAKEGKAHQKIDMIKKAGSLDLPRLQYMLLRALYRPLESSVNLKRSSEYEAFKYDVSEDGKFANDFDAFQAAIEGALIPRDEDGPRNQMREFSGDQNGPCEIRQWLLPALGFLGGVEDPMHPERRQDAFRILISYVLDPRDEDVPSSFAPKPIDQKLVIPSPAPREPRPETAAASAGGDKKIDGAPVPAAVLEKAAAAAADRGATSTAGGGRPSVGGDKRKHLSSKVAFHAMDSILHGIFSLEQKWAAMRAVLGTETLTTLRVSDWVALAEAAMSTGGGAVRSGVMTTQWLAILWMVVQEQEAERVDLGIYNVDRDRPGWKPWSEVWLRAENCDGELLTLVDVVLKAALAPVPAKPGKNTTDFYDVRGLPFSFSDALAYIFPAALAEIWQQACQKAVDRDEGVGEWSDREIFRHFLILRAGREGQGGGVQSAINQLPPKEAATLRGKVSLTMCAYMRQLTVRRHLCWDGVLVMCIECIKANARYAAGEDKNVALRDVLKELVNDNPTVVREATLTLIEIRGPTGAVKEMVQVAQTCSGDIVETLATALRLSAQGDSKKKDDIVTELEEHTQGGPESQQLAARRLMQEFGGSSAMKKLAARSTIGEKYTELMKEAGDKVQEMFEKSLLEARRGFLVALIMDFTLFSVGVLLILLAASMAIVNSRQNSGSWEGTGISGGTGMLAVGYSAFVQNPRKQVKAATDHMMYIKVIFLGYLRELGQVDQAFTRRLMEDGHMTQDELDDFAKTLEKVMRDTVHRMKTMLDTTDKQLLKMMEDPNKDKGPLGVSMPSMGSMMPANIGALAGAAAAAGAAGDGTDGKGAAGKGGGMGGMMGGMLGGAAAGLPGGSMLAGFANSALGGTADGKPKGGASGTAGTVQNWDQYEIKFVLMDLLRRLSSLERDLSAAGAGADVPYSALSGFVGSIEAAMDDARERLQAALSALGARLGLGGGGAGGQSASLGGGRGSRVAPGAGPAALPGSQDAILAQLLHPEAAAASMTSFGDVQPFQGGPSSASLGAAGRQQY